MRWPARFVCPLMLVTIGLVHAYNVRTKRMTTWKGGGFGMFSSLDMEDMRPVRVFLDTERGLLRAAYESDPELRRSAARAQSLPTQHQLSRFASALLGRRWNLLPAAGSDPVLRPASPGDAGSLAGRSVRVEIWRGHFSSKSTAVSAVRLAELIWPPGTPS